MMHLFCEEPFSHDNDVAGVIATTTEKIFILYHVSFTISSFWSPVYIPQAKAWGFDGKSVNEEDEDILLKAAHHDFLYLFYVNGSWGLEVIFDVLPNPAPNGIDESLGLVIGT